MGARPEALLLIGPTGSGKTPLGELLQRRGAAGWRCHHFDFGAQLRALAGASAPPGYFSPEEADLVRGVLSSGRLLEDGEFHVAERLLRGFLASRGVGPDDLVVLNGLPRHAGQARALAALLDVRWVLCLESGAATVRQRIAADAGGDRAGRTDDDPVAVGRRLELYRVRTEPLVGHYRDAGARIGSWVVGPESRPEDGLAAVEELLGC